MAVKRTRIRDRSGVTSDLRHSDSATYALRKLFQKVHFSNNLTTVDQNSPHIIGTTGNEMWATGEWSATIQGQNFGPKQIKGYWSVIREGDDLKIQMLAFNVTAPPAAAPAATPSPTATSSSQWHPDPRPDRLEPGRFDSRRLNDILAIASECLNGSSLHRHSGHRSQRYTINGNATSSAIGAVNSIIQLPKRIARGFKNFQTAAACELAASDSSFQLLINSDHSQKTAKGLILLQI